MSKNQAPLSGWPNGPMSEELIKKIDETRYDDLTQHEKLAWVQRKLGLLEIPNEENTKLTQADDKIQRTFAALERIFEGLWYAVKDDAQGRAIHKCYQKYYDKIGRLKKFKHQVNCIKKKSEQNNRRPHNHRKKRY